MRKILIVCNRTLNIGGIEISLLELVKHLAMDSSNMVSLLIADNKGILFSRLPNNIQLITNQYDKATYGFKDDIKKCRISNIVYGIVHRIKLRMARCFSTKIMEWYKIAAPYFEIIGNFDCAIAYSMDYSDLAIVIDKVVSKKKIAFLHSNPTVDRKAVKQNEKLLMQFDGVFCVSQGVKDLYNIIYPKSAYKTSVFYNIIDPFEIRSKSYEHEDDIEKNKCGIVNILTVGRISPEKGQDRIPIIVKRLVDNGYTIRWYLIGEGSMRKKIEEDVRRMGLNSVLFFLGEKENPYPYINDCDIYVQPSVFEAYAITVHEARVLLKPIVATDFTGIHDQIESGKNGLIVESSVDGLYEGIKKLLDHPEIAQGFVKNLESEVLDNSGELEKLYRFIES